MYPREKMDEISTSFCFICLLHLANERGLKLEVDEDGMPVAVDDDKEGGFSKGKDKRVGELANLKVCC
jgi:condensin complex subunit 2